MSTFYEAASWFFARGAMQGKINIFLFSDFICKC